MKKVQILFFTIFFSQFSLCCFSQDTIQEIAGEKYCSRSFRDIIIKSNNNKTMFSLWPEEIIYNKDYIKTDTTFSKVKMKMKEYTVKKICYYFKDNLKLTITNSAEKLINFFSITLKNDKFSFNETIFLSEKATITLIGMKPNKKKSKIYLSASFDKYKDELSFTFDLSKFNFQLPHYVPCF